MEASPKSGFDFDKYSGLFFEELARARFERPAAGGRLDRADNGLNEANGTILRRVAMGAGAEEGLD
jgi:hypothetical protein